jgi:hypothetical protein
LPPENLTGQDKQDLGDLKASNPQITQMTQISQIFKKLAWLDRLKKWEPSSHKNERAYFCTPGLPIVPKAKPWDPCVAGFPAILASNPGHPVNPV